MMDFLLYDGKVALALLVFYLFYRFLLKKETFHRLNRVVLVGTAVLSFLLPLCVITIHRPMEVGPGAAESAVVATDLPVQELVPMVEPSIPWWPTALIILFWAGVAFVLTRVSISILSIVRIIHQGQLVREEDGCRIIVTNRDIDPFSWMKFIVLSRKDWESPHESILSHEKAHIAYGHSLEVLLVDVLSALQWFNPAIWMLRADLQELHEYEADDAVLRAGTNIKEYQYLLIRKAVSKSGYSVANSFNHSILKNRITMMSKSKSPLSRGWRVLWLLPLVCLAIGLQARTVYVPTDKDSENYVSNETATLSGSVWKGEKSNLSFFDKTFELRSEGFVISGDYSLEGSVIEFIFKDFRNEITGNEKHGKDVFSGVIVDNVLTIRFEDRTMAFSRALPVVLNVRADGTIESGVKVYTVAQLKEVLPSHEAGEPLPAVQIIAADNVRMGAIEDVKLELRKLGALKVQYASASGQEGVTRLMPPYPQADNAKKEDYPEVVISPEVKRENLFVVRINSADRVLFGDKPCQDDEEMLLMGKDFLRKRGKDACFALTVDRGTSYGAYTHMQSLLWRVYEEVRDEKAQEVYGKALAELSEEELQDIYKMVPMGIVEASPKG